MLCFGFVSGHDFSRAAPGEPMRALAPEVLFQVRKTLDEGHGFSRAVNAPADEGLFSPC